MGCDGMNDLQIFNNAEFGSVRTVMIDGEPWFVGKDVAAALGYADPTRAISTHVPDKNKLNYMGGQNTYPSIKDSMGRDQYPIWINQSGMFRLVTHSNLPGAERFNDWMYEEVLPSIFKTGSYSLQAPKTYAEALRALADEAEKAEALQKQNLLMQPKAEFFDAVAGSKTAISLGEVAKVLDMGIGRNKLFEILRQKHILMRNNQPYQQYVDMGYFRVIEQKYEVHGEVRISIKTLVYQKGIDWIRKQLSKGA